MSRFYVGQMVRIVSASLYPGMVGMECVIDAMNVACLGPDGREFLGFGLSVRVPSGAKAVAKSHQIEPITDSYDVTSWDTCVWRPEHLRVEA